MAFDDYVPTLDDEEGNGSAPPPDFAAALAEQAPGVGGLPAAIAASLPPPAVSALPPAPALSPAAGLAPITPQLPPGAQRAGTSITRHILPPGSEDTLRQLDANTDAEKATAREAGGVAEKRAQLQSDEADQRAAAKEAYQQQRKIVVDEAEKELAQKRADHQKAFDTYSNADIKSYWSEKSTFSKVMAGIAVFLGGLSTRGGGGANPASEIIGAAVKQDFDEQRAKIERRKSVVEMAKGNVAEAEAAKVDALRALDIKEAAANAAIAARMKAKALELGVPEARLATDRNVQAIAERALTARQKVNEQDRVTVTETAAAKLGKGKGGGGGGVGAGSGDAESKLAEAAQAGATQADLVRLAYGPLAMRDTKQQKVVDLVQKLWKGAQGAAALETRDEEGNVLGMAANPRAAQKSGEQTAAATAYKNSLLAFKADLSSGVNLNPLSDAWKRRQALHDEVVARARKAMELGVSAAQQALDTGMIGGAGNLGRMASPEVIQRLADEVDKTMQTRLNTTLRRGQQVTETREPPAPSSRARPPAPAGGLSAAERARLLQQLRASPNDPRAPAIRAALGM